MAAWIPVYVGLIILAMLALLVGGLLTPLLLHARERARLYEFLRHCHDQGRPIPADVIGQITAGPVPTREKDLRRGAILLAVAIGLAIPLLIAGRRGLQSGLSVGPLMAICVFGCLGLTFLILGVLRRPRKT
jgi:hypothetical protein